MRMDRDCPAFSLQVSCNTATREMGPWEEQSKEKESNGLMEQSFAHSHSLSFLYFPLIAAEELWSRTEQNEILFHQGE